MVPGFGFPWGRSGLERVWISGRDLRRSYMGRKVRKVGAVPGWPGTGEPGYLRVARRLRILASVVS